MYITAVLHGRQKEGKCKILILKYSKRCTSCIRHTGSSLELLIVNLKKNTFQLSRRNDEERINGSFTVQTKGFIGELAFKRVHFTLNAITE